LLNLSKFLVLAVCAMALALWPDPANAQSWPCPNGPGPGEMQIGMMGGSGGVGATPLCGSNGQDDGEDDEPDGGSYRPQPRRPDVMMSAVWHANSPDVWVSTGFRSLAQAEADAQDACRALMGEGCLIRATWINRSYIAVARDETGYPFIKGGANYESQAKQAALDDCEKASFGCKIDRIYSFSEFPMRFHPRTPRRSTYVVVVWPKNAAAPPWDNSVFLESGLGWTATRDAALARCKAATRVECTVGQTIFDGVAIRYTDTTNRHFWGSKSRTGSVTDRVDSLCAKGQTCSAVELFDSATRRSLTINLARAENPLRGFFAIAWPSTASNWKKVAIVTARQTRAEADTAAIALCQRESGKRCELFLDEGDAGIEPFLGVFSDSNGNTRTHFGKSSALAAGRARTACATAKVTCTQRAMLDLSRPVSTSVALQ